jgi:hypothetical protein
VGDAEFLRHTRLENLLHDPPSISARQIRKEVNTTVPNVRTHGPAIEASQYVPAIQNSKLKIQNSQLSGANGAAQLR